MIQSIKPTCTDCGAAPVNHAAARFSVVVDKIVDTYLAPLDGVYAFLDPWLRRLDLQRIVPPLLRALAALKLITILTEPNVQDGPRTRCLWESAKKRGIRMYKMGLFGQPTELTIAEFDVGLQVFMSLPRPPGPKSGALDWMDNKAIMKEKFLAAGIPVPRGGVARTEKQALNIFRAITSPVIAKPILGSRARHTTIAITTEAGLLEGFYKAKQLSPWVIIEEQLQGMGVHRPTVIGGRVVGIVNKEPPHVFGNGQSTVRMLVEQENKNPLRQGPVFHHIVMGNEAELVLRRQDFIWESVPAAGVCIILSDQTSRSFGGSITDETDTAHPDNIALFQKVAGVLNDPLVGIDFIITDITRSWKDQPFCGVIECNSLPFVDLHHFPLVGNPRDVAGELWDIVFPSAKRV